MSLEGAIAMEPIKVKLRNLQEHLPNEPRIVYDFATFLADRLNSTLVPRGFLLAVELALYDAQGGVDGFTGKPVSGRLHGYSPQMYRFLRMFVPQIAEAVCPEDFAKSVREAYDAVNTELRKGSE